MLSVAKLRLTSAKVVLKSGLPRGEETRGRRGREGEGPMVKREDACKALREGGATARYARRGHR